MPAPWLLPGTLLRETYRIGGVLGQGGFGITYHALDERLGLPVAIKEFFLSGSAREGLRVVPPLGVPPEVVGHALRRFLDEAQALARFDHPGIVRVLGSFEENRTGYIVMELLQGETLEAWLGRMGRLGEAQVAWIAHTVGGALAEVHRAGLFHQDVKPANIMSLPSGRLVLLDFGAARQHATTRAYTVLLTPGYAPPEQYSATGQRGPWSDVYSLGATLYQLLTGVKPPTPPDRAMGQADLAPVQHFSPQVSPEMGDAVLWALTMDRTARPQGMEEFLARVPRPLSSGGPGAPSRGSAPTPPPLPGAGPWAPAGGSAPTPPPLPGAGPWAPAGGSAPTPPPLPGAGPWAPAGGSAPTPPPLPGAGPWAPPGGSPPVAPPIPGTGGWRAAGSTGPASLPPTVLGMGSTAGSSAGWDLGLPAPVRPPRRSPWMPGALAALALLLVLGGFWVFRRPSPAPGPSTSPATSMASANAPSASPATPAPPLQGQPPSPSGVTIPSPSPPGGVKPTPPARPLLTARLAREFSCQGPINSIDWMPPPNELVVAASDDRTLRGWNIRTGRQESKLRGPPARCTSLAVSSDGKIVASISSDGKLRFFNNWENRQTLSMTGANTHTTDVLAFSRNGALLGTLTMRGTLVLVQVRTRSVLRHLGGVEHPTSFAFSPDARTVALSGRPPAILLYDTSSGRLVKRLEGHTQVVQALDYSPDGRHLASASEDGTVRLWDVRAGTSAPLFLGDRGFTVRFSPDGRLLAVGCRDGGVRVFLLEGGTGFVALRLQGGGMVRSVSFRRGHREWLAAGFSDGRVRVWEISGLP